METASTQSGVAEKVLHALGSTSGYFTIHRLADVTGSLAPQIEGYVETHPERVRKSWIETDDGQPLYTLNTPFSGIMDAWSAFRYLNAKKF